MRSRQEIMDAVETQVKKYPNVHGVVECSVLTAILDVLFDLREQNDQLLYALSGPIRAAVLPERKEQCSRCGFIGEDTAMADHFRTHRL